MQSPLPNEVEEWLASPQGTEWEFTLYLTAFNEGYDNAIANEFNGEIFCPGCETMYEVSDEVDE